VAKCVVCGAEDGGRLIKCRNPRCRAWVCRRHALRFEVTGDIEPELALFCSRACYVEVQRRALPDAKALLIAAVVLLLAFLFYWWLVTPFL
jgi:hypothetical protein